MNPASRSLPDFTRSALPLASLGLWWLATLLWWGLAFAPGGAGGPEWVGALQAVCFGTGPDGLPAPYGWGALIAAPLGMLALLLVAWSAELRAGLPLLRRPLGMALALLMLGALLGEAGWVGWRIAGALEPSEGFTLGTQPGPLPAGYPRLNEPAPGFALTSQHGRTLRLEDFRGTPLLLTFAFGHCAQICPSTVRHLEAAARTLDAPRPRIVVITLDAWRDTPAALSGIAERWALDPQTVLLSGDVWAVNATLDAYNVARRRDEHTGNIEHPPMVYVVDAQGRLAYAFVNPSPRWLLDAVRRARTPAS